MQVKETGEQTRALALDLMGAILSHSNSAYKQVKQNKGVAGIDQMPVGEFAAWYAENGEILIDRLKEKVRPLTKRNRGVKFEQIMSELIPLLRGWLNFFQYARCKSLLMNLDSWIRRKLRCYRLKQCKRAITLQRFLESQGVESWQSWILALSGKGHWRKSGCPQANQAMSNSWFNDVGLYNLILNYERLNN